MKLKAVLRPFHLFLCLCIVFTVSFSSMASAMGAPSSTVLATDIKGSAAESQIKYFLKKGILTVYSNKTFKPNQIIKRIEFITAVNKLFGFSQTTNISFKDVPAKSTNFKEVSKAISAGYIGGFSDKTFKPNNAVTRQEAAQIICKLLNYTAYKDSNILKKIKDINFTSNSYLSYISTAVQKGYLGLYAGNRFNPSKKLTRADAAYLFGKMAKTVFNKAGGYINADGSKTVNGNVIVNTSGITLNNLVINGNLYLTQGIGEGNAALVNVTVKGNTYINGGGLNSITLINSTLGAAFINKKNGAVRVVTSGSTSIGNLTVNSSCYLVESGLTGNGFTNMTVNLLVPKGRPIELMGSFGNITLNSKMTEIGLSNGSINNFTSSQGASGTTLRVEASASIKNIVLNAPAKVLGKGSIRTVDIRSAKVTVEPNPTYVLVKKGITAIVNGLTTRDTVSFLPSLTSADINLSTGKLTLSGENLASITGVNNDITAAKLTISSGAFGRSRTLTASSNADIISSTSAILQLTDADIISIKSMLDHSSKTYKISAAMGWNGQNSPPDYSGNKVTFSGRPQPVINSATLNLSTGTLVLSGLYFTAISGSANDITASNFTISDGNGGHSRTLSYTADTEITNSSSAKLTLSSTDLTAIKTWALQNGISVNGYSYNIAASANWNGTNSPADLTGNPVTVSGNQLPTITNATFTVSTGKLFLTGTNFISISGSSNDITASKLTFSDGYGGHSRMLSTSSNVDISSSTTATITVSGADLTTISSWAVQNGTTLYGNAYNISADAGWNGSDSQADLTGNPVTVSANLRPDITNATLDLSTGYLTLSGTNLVSISGTNNDIISSYLTISDGTGGHSRALSYTTNFDIINSNYAIAQVSSTDLVSITNWATQNGSSVNGYSYLIMASAGWNGTSSYYDSSNPLTVSGAQASNITSASLNLSTGQLLLYGNFVSVVGSNNDIVPTKFSITDGTSGHNYKITATSGVDLSSSSTPTTLVLSEADCNAIKTWATQNGTNLNSNYYRIIASAEWNGPTSLADSGKPLTITWDASPSITSASLNLSTGVLTLTGTNFVSVLGASNDITASKITISDGGTNSTTLTSDTINVDVLNSTTATLTLGILTDLKSVKAWATQNGTSVSGKAYMISVAADWNGSSSTAINNIAPVIVSGISGPALQSALRDSSTQITVTFSKLTDPATITKSNNGGFIVFDVSKPAATFIVTAVKPGTTNDKAVLTVDASSGDCANLKVMYTAGGNGTITDAGGNPLSTDANGIAVTNGPAPALTSAPTLTSSSTLNQTVITLTALPAGHSYKCFLSSDSNPVPAPNIGTNLSGWISITSGSVINAASRKYIVVAEVDSNNLVLRFSIIAVSSSTAPALQGGLLFQDVAGPTNNGKTKVNFGAPSAPGNTFKYLISPDGNPVPPQVVGFNASSWAPVTNGDIIKAENSKHIGIAEVDASGHVVCFSDATAVALDYVAAKPPVKIADAVLGGSPAVLVNFATIIANGSGPELKLVLNGTNITLTNVKSLGNKYDAAGNINAVKTALQTDIITSTGSNNYSVNVVNGILSITTSVNGSTSVINLTGSDAAIASALGFINLGPVNGVDAQN